jgi:hypothetical protein
MGGGAFAHRLSCCVVGARAGRRHGRPWRRRRGPRESRRRRLGRAGGEALAKETRAEGFTAAEAWACGWGGAGEGDEGRGIRGGGGAGVRAGFAAVEARAGFAAVEAARAGGLPGGGSLHCALNS